MTHIPRKATDREIAAIIDVTMAVNNVYRRSIGEEPRDPGDAELRARVGHGIRNLLTHRNFDDPVANHERWREARARDGWRYGPVDSAEERTHPDMRDYNELPAAARVKNELFLAIVKAMAPE